MITIVFNGKAFLNIYVFNHFFFGNTWTFCVCLMFSGSLFHRKAAAAAITRIQSPRWGSDSCDLVDDFKVGLLFYQFTDVCRCSSKEALICKHRELDHWSVWQREPREVVKYRCGVISALGSCDENTNINIKIF